MAQKTCRQVAQELREVSDDLTTLYYEGKAIIQSNNLNKVKASKGLSLQQVLTSIDAAQKAIIALKMQLLQIEF